MSDRALQQSVSADHVCSCGYIKLRYSLLVGQSSGDRRCSVGDDVAATRLSQMTRRGE